MTNESLYAEAVTHFPGGVSSPVRAFKSVGGTPKFFKKAKGAWFEDEDGKSYVDLCMSWGPLILGHAHPDVLAAVTEAMQEGLTFGAPSRRELALARRIKEMAPWVEKMRFVSSGTEAVMSALRAARGFTKRDRILNIFLRQKGHLSADELCDLVRREDAGIGRATVYRTLQWMVTAGIARKVDFGEGRSRFEPSYRHPRHFHFVCNECHRSSEFLSSDVESLVEEIASARHFTPEQQVVQIYGTCEECRTGKTTPPIDGAAAITPSSEPCSPSHLTAVFGPTFGTPGTLSTASPTSGREVSGEPATVASVTMTCVMTGRFVPQPCGATSRATRTGALVTPFDAVATASTA